MKLNIKDNLKTFNKILFTQKKFFLITCGIFLLGIISGYFLPAIIKIEMLGSLGDKIEGIMDPNPYKLAFNIFINNVFAASLALLLFILILPSVFIPFINGLAIGMLLDLQLRMNNVADTSLTLFFISILPHGILEIPAFLTAIDLAFISFFKVILHKRFLSEISVKKYFASIAIGFVIIITPTLFMAAIIETFITPVFIEEYQSNQETNYNKDLKEFIITEKDLSEFDFKEKDIDEEEYNSIFRQSKGLNFKSYVEIIYDDESLDALKDFKEAKWAINSFLSDNDEENQLNIAVYSFENRYKEDFSAFLNKQIGKKYKVNMEGETGLKYVYNTKEEDPQGIYFDCLEKRCMLISYVGEDLDIFDSVIEMQTDEIKK